MNDNILNCEQHLLEKSCDFLLMSCPVLLPIGFYVNKFFEAVVYCLKDAGTAMIILPNEDTQACFLQFSEAAKHYRLQVNTNPLCNFAFDHI